MELASILTQCKTLGTMKVIKRICRQSILKWAESQPNMLWASSCFAQLIIKPESPHVIYPAITHEPLYDFATRLKIKLSQLNKRLTTTNLQWLFGQYSRSAFLPPHARLQLKEQLLQM